MSLLYNTLGPYFIIINNSNMCFVVKGYIGIIGMPGLWFDSGIMYYIPYSGNVWQGESLANHQ